MNHILKNLKTEIKFILDSHADNTTIDTLMKEFKREMSQYTIIGNQSRLRGVTVLIKKSCGYTTANVKLLDECNTVQFDLIAPDLEVYNIVAIYTPVGQENAEYWASLHDKISIESTHQILIGDFNAP